MSCESPSRIAFLVPHTGRSGAEVTLEQLLRGLPHDLFEAYVVAPEKQPLISIAQSIGFCGFVYPFPKFLSTSAEIGERRIINPFAVLYNVILLIMLALRLNRWLRRNRIQILYTISTFGHLTGAPACIGTRCKIVWHVHDILSKQFAGGFGRIVFGCFARYFVDQIVVPSQAVAASILYAKNVVVIPNAVDIEKYIQVQSSTLRQELEIDPMVPIIGMIARLTPWKGQRLFLEAIAEIKEMGYKSYFIIVGDAIFSKRDYRVELQLLSKRLQTDNCVSFLGFRDDIPNIMKGLDILIVPSLRPEPFGLVAIEAMAAGKPVIGSNSGGLVDIIVHEQTGLLFKIGDADDLAQAIKMLILEPDLRVRYGKAGFERVRQEYTIDHYVSQVVELLSAMIRNN